MKSLEQLEKFYGGKEEKKSPRSPSSKLPLVKKMDLLYLMHTEIKGLDKKALSAIKKRVVAILELMANEGAGALLSRILGTIYEEIFEQVDRSRLPQFFDQEMQALGSSKIEPSHKMYIFRFKHLELIFF